MTGYSSAIGLGKGYRTILQIPLVLVTAHDQVHQVHRKSWLGAYGSCGHGSQQMACVTRSRAPQSATAWFEWVLSRDGWSTRRIAGALHRV